MSDQAAPEPTMEEILASIRRIISEDDAPAPGKADDADWRPPAPAAGVQGEATGTSAEDAVLELSERTAAVSVSASETHGDVEAYTPAAPTTVEEPAPPVAEAAPPAPAPAPDLVATEAAEKSATAFGQLAAAVTRPAPAAPPPPPSPALPAAGRTLEDLTTDLLRPLLKAWLDENLPRIVQARVDEEVARIARSQVR